MFAKSSLTALSLAALLTFGCQSTKDNSGSSAAAPAAPSAAPAAPAAEAPQMPEYVQRAQGMEQTTIEFASSEYNFGSVATGTKVTHQFRFKNTGTAPLTLTLVKPSCGCTTPSYSSEPVQPGQDGFIDVKFDTAGKTGKQTKTVQVYGNFNGASGNSVVLRITGEVSGDSKAVQ